MAARPIRPVLNKIEPKRGMALQVYMSRVDIGSGVRSFLVIGVSSRYVTLFYASKLKAIKIRRKEWPYYHAVEYVPDRDSLAHIIQTNRGICLRERMRFDGKSTAKALEILGKHWEKRP